jgi:hypothetical protein
VELGEGGVDVDGLGGVDGEMDVEVVEPKAVELGERGGGGLEMEGAVLGEEEGVEDGGGVEGDGVEEEDLPLGVGDGAGDGEVLRGGGAAYSEGEEKENGCNPTECKEREGRDFSTERCIPTECKEEGGGVIIFLEGKKTLVIDRFLPSQE